MPVSAFFSLCRYRLDATDRGEQQFLLALQLDLAFAYFVDPDEAVTVAKRVSEVARVAYGPGERAGSDIVVVADSLDDCFGEVSGGGDLSAGFLVVVAEDLEFDLAGVGAFSVDEAHYLGVQLELTLDHRHTIDVVQQAGGEAAAAAGGGTLFLIGERHRVAPQVIDIQTALLQFAERRNEHHAGDDSAGGIEADADDHAVSGIDPVHRRGRSGVGCAQDRRGHGRVGLHGLGNLVDLRFVLLEQSKCTRLRQR